MLMRSISLFSQFAKRRTESFRDTRFTWIALTVAIYIVENVAVNLGEPAS